MGESWKEREIPGKTLSHTFVAYETQVLKLGFCFNGVNRSRSMSLSQLSDYDDENMLILLWIRHWVNSNLCLDRVRSLQKHIVELVVATAALMTLFPCGNLDHGRLISLLV
jgi:hypothetical protein